MTVFLENLHFNVPRGTSKEEHLIGTELRIDVHVTFNELPRIESEQHTVSYVELYEMVKRKIREPGSLLETVAMDICRDVKTAFPAIIEFNITIRKMQPPILNFQGHAGVTFKTVFEN